MIRRTLAAAALVLVATAPAHAGQPLPVSFHAWTTASDFTAPGASFEGAKLPKDGGAITYGSTAGTAAYSDPYGSPARTYAYARWTSPWFQTGFGFTELVSSWNATTPVGTWIQVEMEASRDSGATSTKWYTMGRWASGDGDIHRNSVGGQGDADGYVAIDTFFAKDHPFTGYRLRVTLWKLPGRSAGPTVSSVGTVASDMPNANPYVPSPLGGAEGIELAVPRFSQEIHAGEYPQFDGGGEAWCSPTSTSMILAYWNRGPAPADYAYVLEDYPNVVDPWVDFAARATYDYHYQGTGNWPFNTAYASTYGLEAEVTQLRSLTEAEQFVKVGIPLVASIAFEPNKLDGFLFRGTDGHLLTIVGFTPAGDVISNDPASSSGATVRHVYDRAQFEKAWLHATGGIVYVIHPPSVPLPPAAVPSQPNW
ncbi:MAG TPA: C39 family peptidase [Gaiellaceae bacterium]|nr:C39 family peptidase [Gaiellaceae bacterium]